MLKYHDVLQRTRTDLRHWKEIIEANPSIADACPEHTEELELEIDALERAEKEVTMDKWIKPSDKMPEVNENVIICRMYDADTPIVEQAHWEGSDGDWWKVFGTRVKTKNILFWQPMPEPPEEVRK